MSKVWIDNENRTYLKVCALVEIAEDPLSLTILHHGVMINQRGIMAKDFTQCIMALHLQMQRRS